MHLRGGVFDDPVSALGISSPSPAILQLNLDNRLIVAGKQTVTVQYDTASAEAGYHVTMSVAETGRQAGAALVGSNGREVPSITNASQSNPRALDPGTWGYAIPGRGGFDPMYEVDSDVTAKWATVPVSGTSEAIAETSGGGASGSQSYDIWFAVRNSDNGMMPAGEYSANIVYTVAANPVVPAEITTVSPNTYNLGDTTVPARVTINGANLVTVGAKDGVNDVCIVPADEQAADCSGSSARFAVNIVETPTYNTLIVDLPNDPSIPTGDYNVLVRNQSGAWTKAPTTFKYTKVISITGISPDSYDLDGDQPIAMAGSSTHRVILTESGQVFTAGSNDHGQLGVGTIGGDGDVNVLHNITAQFADKVVSVSAVGDFTLALTESGRVYSWGYNAQGELGDGTTTNSGSVVDITNNFGLPAGRKVIKVYAGWEQAFAITDDGRLYSWGNDADGRLGRDVSVVSHALPAPVTDVFDGDIVDLATDSHTLVLTDTNKVYAWGLNSNGQVGNGESGTNADGSYKSVSEPYLVATDAFGGNEIVQVEASSNGSFARTSDGQLYAWGQNDYGNLGFGEEISSYREGSIFGGYTNTVLTSDLREPTTPTLVEFFSQSGGERIAMFGAGFHRTIAITTSSQVLVWGDNNLGGLGMGNQDNEFKICTFHDGWLGDYVTDCGNTYYAQRAPVSLGDSYAGVFGAVFASGDALFAIGTDGHVYSWGNGNTPVEGDITGGVHYEEAVIMGANMDDFEHLFIDINRNSQLDDGEECRIAADDSRRSSSRIYCTIPTGNEEVLAIPAGASQSYAVGGVTTDGAVVMSDVRFTYYRD